MADEQNGGMPDLSGIFEMLSKNPGVMEMAMNMFSGAGSVSAPKVQADPEEDVGTVVSNEAEETKVSAVPPTPSFDPSMLKMLMSSMSASSSGKASSQSKNYNDRRVALLSALKPYLSPERRTALDYIQNFSRIGDLLKTFDTKGE